MPRLGLAAVLALLLVAAGCGSLKREETATARCDASDADLELDSTKHIRVRVHGRVIAEVGPATRGLDLKSCRRARTQRGWKTDIRYARLRVGRLHCHFGNGFFIHVHPTVSSDSGDHPDGSALYLVVGRRHLIVASAAVAEDESSLSFAARYCTQPPGLA